MTPRSRAEVIAELIGKWRAIPEVEPFGLPYTMWRRAKRECADELEHVLAHLPVEAPADRDLMHIVHVLPCFLPDEALSQALADMDVGLGLAEFKARLKAHAARVAGGQLLKAAKRSDPPSASLVPEQDEEKNTNEDKA